jgi:hypothetical protein
MFKNKKTKKSLLGAWLPLVFNLNQANMDTPVHATAVSANGFNPDDDTKHLYANDANIFLYRTNFTGDLKTVKTVSASTLAIPSTGQADYFYYYEVTASACLITLDTNALPPGATIKIYNAGSGVLQLATNQPTDPLLYQGIFAGCVAEITVFGPTSVFVKNISPSNLPIASTGQLLYTAQSGLEPPQGFIVLDVLTRIGYGSGDTFYTWNLYNMIWPLIGVGSGYAIGGGGKGASALADFQANKPMLIPDHYGFCLTALIPAAPFAAVTGSNSANLYPANIPDLSVSGTCTTSGNIVLQLWTPSGGEIDGISAIDPSAHSPGDYTIPFSANGAISGTAHGNGSGIGGAFPTQTQCYMYPMYLKL